MTATDLRKSEAAYRAASLRAEKARRARNEAVQAALREGWSHGRIAAATGLTRARVGQIALQR